jgi:hypothetical protein
MLMTYAYENHQHLFSKKKDFLFDEKTDNTI